MTSIKQDTNYSKLITELKKLTTETIGSALNQDAQLFQDFTDRFVQSIDEYNSNAAEALNKGSLQALLFENERFSKNVFLLLEEMIKEETPSLLKETMNKFIVDAYQQLELIPENEFISEQIRIARSKKKKSGILALAEKFKPKTPVGLKTEGDGISFSSYNQFPNRNFFFYYLILSNVKKQFDLYNAFISNLILLLNQLWNLDKKRIEQFSQFASTNFQIDSGTHTLRIDYQIDEIQKLINEFIVSKDQIPEGINIGISNFVNDFASGKIIEHDTYQSNVDIKKEGERLVHALIKNQQNWQHSIFLFAEDWKLDLEINSFRFSFLKQFFNFSQVMDTRFTGPVEEIIELMNLSLDELKLNVEKSGNKTKAKFTQQFSDSKAEFKRNFRLKFIPSLKEVIIKSEIPKAIDGIETDTSSYFNEISEKRFVTNSLEYNRPIEKSEFQSISPKDLVGYEFMPQLKAVFPDLKITFINHVQSFERKVTEIPEIIDFAIESSLSFYENESNVEEAIKISTEGIVRAEKKLEEISGLHQSFIQKEVDTLKLSIDQFVNEITAMADSESASQINLRIVKLQALAKSKEIRKNISMRIKNFIPVAVGNINRGVRFLGRSSEKISKQFKIEEKQQFITSDTSDYLAATEATINKLPFIYQRLFKIEPLKSFELFIGRDKPAEMLSNAYTKWKEGRFAPVVIIGEKGSGKTTILNWFLKTKIHNENVILLDLHEVNKTPEMFYNEIEALVADKRNVVAPPSGSRNTILAIDGLARLFTTEINGFSYLMKTMKLISETNSQVFWIVSAHLYSWYYIDKSFNISDYFAYHIKLTDINAEDLKHIIEKRHNISGFRLIYEPLPAKKSLVRSKKLSNEKTQPELEEAYFKSLTEFNNNNLSQAFLYWLRSTSQVENDAIYIRQISEIKNNFIKSISLPKMITLKNILVHNGITIEGHARKFNQDIELSKLHLDQMKDDGLLVMAQDYYLINPLIYSQIINELYILNLLH